MTKITRILFAVLALAIMFLSSCSQEAMYIDDETDDSTLTIYLVEGSDLYTKAITTYNNLIDRGEIEGRKVKIIEYASDDSQQISDQIFTELLSGGGPDFLVIQDSQYDNLYKAMENGSVADMDMLIQNNPAFNPNNYKMDILDAGIINGQRCFIPIGYYVPYLLTTEENFEEYGIELPGEFTIDSLLQTVNAFNEQGSYFNGTYILISYGAMDALAHYEENQTLGTEYFNKIYNAMDEMIDKYPVYQGAPGNIDELGAGNISLLLQGNFFFPFSHYWLPVIYYNDLHNEYNKTPIILNMPCSLSGKPTAFVSNGLAININSKHKNAAFQFILYLLSEEVQLGTPGTAPSLPVNKAAAEQVKDNLISGEFLRGTVLASVKIPEEFCRQLIATIEDYDEVLYTGQANYIYSNVLADIPEDLPYEERIAEMNRRLRIYFSE